MARVTLCMTLLSLVALALALRHPIFFHNELTQRMNRVYDDKFNLPEEHKPQPPHGAPGDDVTQMNSHSHSNASHDPEIYGVGSYNVEVSGIIGGRVVFPFKGTMTRFVMSANNTVHRHKHHHGGHDDLVESNKSDKHNPHRPPKRLPKSSKSYSHVNVTVQVPLPQKTLQLNLYAFRNKTAIDSFAVAEIPQVVNKCMQEHLKPSKSKYICRKVPEPNLKRSTCGPDGNGQILARECSYSNDQNKTVKMRFMYCRSPSKSLLWIRMKKLVNDEMRFYVHATVTKNLPLPTSSDLSQFRVPDVCFQSNHSHSNSTDSNSTEPKHHHDRGHHHNGTAQESDLHDAESDEHRGHHPHVVIPESHHHDGGVNHHKKPDAHDDDVETMKHRRHGGHHHITMASKHEDKLHEEAHHKWMKHHPRGRHHHGIPDEEASRLPEHHHRSASHHDKPHEVEENDLERHNRHGTHHRHHNVETAPGNEQGEGEGGKELMPQHLEALHAIQAMFGNH